MKHLLTIILTFNLIFLVAQTNEIQKFQKDVVQGQLMKYEGETKISSSIDSAWMADILMRTNSDSTENSLIFKSTNSIDSIVLTEIERDLIFSFFKNPKNLELTVNPTKFDTIDINKVLDHLRKNHDNQIVFISQPLFIRQGKIGIVFFANLCCGHIYGHVNFSFYLQENSIWTRWIDMSSGAYKKN